MLKFILIVEVGVQVALGWSHKVTFLALNVSKQCLIQTICEKMALIIIIYLKYAGCSTFSIYVDLA